MRYLLTSLRWLVLILAALAFNLPIIATFVTSLKTAAEINTNPGWMIDEITWNNYLSIFQMKERLDIFSYLENSLISSTIGAVLPIILTFPLAYAIVRRGYGKNILLPIIINLRVLPLIIFAIPIYMLYQFVGLLDTRLGLGFILAIVNLPLTLIMLTNAMNEIPKELNQAAQMDGAHLFSLMLNILLPLCRSTLAIIFVFAFVTGWNEFLFGLMLSTSEAVPVTVGSSFFFAAGGGGVQWGVAAAAMMVAAFPPVVVGLMAYRQITTSIISGAVKG